MGNDCTYSRQPQRRKSQIINILSQSYPKRSSVQIFLTPHLNPRYKQIQSFQASSVICQDENGNQKTQEKQSQISAETKIAKEQVAAQVKQTILQELQTKSTLQGQKVTKLNKERVQNELEESIWSRRKIQLNVECPSQMRESLVSEWDKSNFNDALFFKAVCYDSIFLNSNKLTPSQP